MIERARSGGERDEQLAVAAADSRRHLRIVIALPAQQRGEQFGILARAPVELRGVGGIAVMRLQRREFVETLAQQRRCGGVEPLDREAVAHLAGDLAGLAGVGLFWTSLGPSGPL